MTKLESAFRQINRIDFVPEDLRSLSDNDVPLPIGFGQTISQPTTVRMMLEWLKVESGNKVLDVGSGSGWTSALLSCLVGRKGTVDAVELVPDLVELGRRNCERIGIKNIRFHQSGRVYGLPKKAPFDRILVSASANELPQELLTQLKVGGKMVIPVRHDILEIEKLAPNRYKTVAHPGFVFVPLVQQFG